MPVGYWLVSRTACTLRPVAVVVLAIRSTMTWWLVSGRPRQFRVIWENSRCAAVAMRSQTGRGRRPLIGWRAPNAADADVRVASPGRTQHAGWPLATPP